VLSAGIAVQKNPFNTSFVNSGFRTLPGVSQEMQRNYINLLELYSYFFHYKFHTRKEISHNNEYQENSGAE